jgi:hypothetical protein
LNGRKKSTLAVATSGRRKMMKIISLLLGLMFIPAILLATSGFRFVMVNDTEAVRIYNIWHIDSKYGPMIIAGGELPAGEKREITVNYNPGYYAIVWLQTKTEPRKVFQFIVKKNAGRVIADRNGVEILIKS